MDAVYLLYILSGAVVGLAVGITGVGGGSLMTPLLLLFGFPAHIAIGTDLLYAAITKSGGIVFHHRKRTICWPLVAALALGSVPAALFTSLLLKLFFTNASDYGSLLTSTLGLMLILTSTVIMFKKRLQADAASNIGFLASIHRHPKKFTFFMGILLGVMVTLSSVGAGVFGAALLITLYPHLNAKQVVGTDIAHAVPLTLIAGLGHLFLGNVDFTLLTCLLIGSLPAIHFGTHISSRLPNHVLQPILVSLLMVLGIKFLFF